MTSNSTATATAADVRNNSGPCDVFDCDVSNSDGVGRCIRGVFARHRTIEFLVSNRIGKPAEAADAALYLVSPMSSLVTGVALVLDGGTLLPAGGMGFQEGGTGADTQK